MTIYERIKAFLLRKRRWQWLLVGLAIVLLGRFVEARNIEPQSIAAMGQRLTVGLHDRLARAQPTMVTDLYTRAGAGRHGLGWCGPTKALAPLSLNPDHLERKIRRANGGSGQSPVSPGAGELLAKGILPGSSEAGPPSPSSTPDLAAVLRDAARRHPAETGLGSDSIGEMVRDRDRGAPTAAAPIAKPLWDCSQGWLNIADDAVLTLRITPEISYAVWTQGGWAATALLALTLGGMALVLVWIWNQKDIGCAAFPATLLIFCTGPLIAGGVFWLMLQLLLGFTAVLGTVLAGLTLVLTWIAAGSKMVAMLVEVITRGDEAREHFDTVRATFGLDGPPSESPAPSTTPPPPGD